MKIESIYIYLKHTYLGQVELIEKPYIVQENDNRGQLRLVYKFPLRIINKQFMIDQDRLGIAQEEKERSLKNISLEELTKSAKLISNANIALDAKPKERNMGNKGYRYTKKKEYIRNPLIADYVKKIAEGICQLCHHQAPFKK